MLGPLSKSTISIITLVIFLIGSLLLPGCSKNTEDKSATGVKPTGIKTDNIPAVNITPPEWTKYPAPTPSPEVTPRTGKIDTGTSVPVASKTIDKDGGEIIVNKSGDPLNGLKIKVPSGAYPGSTNFKISSAPVTSHTFGTDFNPISPVITVENGGGYSEELMELTVPVKVPAEHFAMGFLYDEKTGKLEGMPLLRSDGNSITVITRHFSKTVISSILKTLLSEEADSGFRPGIDDWEFPNWGSAYKPKGHCAGQSMTAMWYYCMKPDGAKARLWDKYDNFGNGSPTPDFWYDDSHAYRFASMVQSDMDWNNQEKKLLEKIGDTSDEAVWKMFSYAMRLSKEPQLVCIARDGGGHAMIVYKIQDGALWVADPNYPSDPYRKIEYESGKFKPYVSAENADELAKGNFRSYPLIRFYAKTTCWKWSDVSARWQEMKAMTIGNDKFPTYHISIKKDEKSDWEVLTADVYKTNNELIKVCPFDNNGDSFPWNYYRYNKVLSSQSNWIKLEPGDNRIGLFIMQEQGGKYKYVDFKYVTVNYEPATPTPTPAKTVPKSTEKTQNRPVIESISGPTKMLDSGLLTFTVKVSGGSSPYYYEWYGLGAKPMFQGTKYSNLELEAGKGGFSSDSRASWIRVKVKDSNGVYAAWVDEMGWTKDEFSYGIKPGGGVVTLPAKFPYKSAP